MDEIKDAISIVKARWPEVSLILGLHVLTSLSAGPLQRLGKLSPSLTLLICVCMLAVLVVTVMLPVGFLRAVHLESQKRQSPGTLLRLGKHFFWRAIGFGLLFTVAYLLLAWLVFRLAKQPLAITTGFWETAETDPLLYFCCYAMAQLILIKPMLLVMPTIIVTDCRISRSFESLRRCTLSQAEGLVILYVISTAFTVLWAFLPSGEEARTISLYTLRIPLSLTQQLIGVIMGVMAVRFVGSCNLSDDADPDLPDPGDASS